MMKKTSVALVFILCFSFNITAQKDTITQRIILIGDGGSLTNGRHPVRDAVRKLIPLDKKTTVLFLGDNIYPSGLQDEELYNYDDGKAALDSQLAIADGTDAKIIMIPGNHDWDEGKRTGYEGILREQIYVDYFSGKKNVNFLPKDGCPGPVEVPLGNDVTLVLFDSQWWLHEFDKPGVESDCDCKTEDELLGQLQDILNRNLKKLVIFACHHPFKSNGIHGGNYTLKQHLFPFTDISQKLYIPLPVIGSIYPIARSVFGTPQDLPHPNYVNMINKISAVAKSHPKLVFVAGHEHNLQLIQDSSFSYIVSGGGCKSSRVSKTKKSPYVVDAPGFVVLEVSTNKNLTSAFYTVEAGATMAADSIKRAYDTTLLNFSVIPEPVQDSTVRVVKPGIRFKDTVNISASDKYPLITGFKKYMIGQNYRPEWNTVVNMKVFDLKTVKGGLRITGIGGGKQTKSLKLVDKKGKQWVLRSVDKNPTKALPENFRGSLAQDLVQEFNSAAHPYAPLTIPTMAKALKIVAPTPELYFVPDDPELGFYQQLFANTVCMLEETDVTTDGSDTKSTAKIFSKMLEDNDHRADQFAVLKARLLDILIGDFDRHFDQWKWATADTGKGKLYYPIPKDRDQAYFFSDGKLIKMVSRSLMPFLSGFKNKIENVDWLGFSARDFDRLFLTDLDREEWMKTVLEFQKTLTDDIIRDAIKKLPPEVFSINGETLIKKLISRRDMLAEAAMEYYRFISRKVYVLGSNKKEYFKISMDKNDTLHLKVFAREIGKDTGFVMYERKFNPATTHELQLYGLNGNDLFDIDENVKSKIKIRIIGGKGNDTFDIKGNTKVLLYDIKAEGNNIRHSAKETKNRFSKDPPVNTNSFTGFRYNKTKFPKILLGANAEEGFLAGIGFERTTHGFRNLPYATNQDFSALYSVSHKAYHLKYFGEFNHITRNTDLVLKGEMQSPTLNFFFGLGNNTKLTQPVSSGFYRARYNSVELEAMLRKRYSDIFHFSIGPYFYHYEGKYQNNNDKVLGNPASLGLDSADIFSKKNYLGGKVILLIDNRNNDFFPTRGVHWNTELLSAAGIGNGSNSIIRLASDMRVYASMSDPANVVAVLGLGGGRIYSKNFEYFQALSLGADQNLHGFRKNRYMGRSSLYGSFEVKVKLFDVKSYVIPGPFGITGFYDIGRVWMPNEVSKKWHGAFGGGFYFLPFHAFTITATAGFSNSEKIFNFSFGTKVNLTY